MCKRPPFSIPFTADEIHPVSQVDDLERILKGRLTDREAELFDLMIARLGGWVLYDDIPCSTELTQEELSKMIDWLRTKLRKIFGWTILTSRDNGCMLYPLSLLAPKPEYEEGEAAIANLIAMVNRRLDDRCSWCDKGIQRGVFSYLAARPEKLVLYEDVCSEVWGYVPTRSAMSTTKRYLLLLLKATGWTVVTIPGMGWKLHRE